MNPEPPPDHPAPDHAAPDHPVTDRPVPKPASTVMLVRAARPGGEGLEVFVLHRVPGMAFAPSVTVFPGGGVDPSDSTDPPWAGPHRHWWATALGVRPDRAASLVVAAVRELFEETGVLLADGELPEATRQAIAEHRTSLAAALSAARLSLESGRLRPWARWITPVGGARRYDTFFFVAALPAGQQARMLTTEAESGRWSRPGELLTEYHNGTLAMMPPTVAMLTDLDQIGSVESAMTARRPVPPITPTVLSRPGEPLRVTADGRVFDIFGKV